MADEPVHVRFDPDGQRLEVHRGTSLLAAVLRAGRPVGYACRGRGVCVACRLRVTGPTSAIDPAEQALLDTLDDPAAYRIACLARIEGDVSVRADYW